MKIIRNKDYFTSKAKYWKQTDNEIKEDYEDEIHILVQILEHSQVARSR